jgi:nucleotide-binding universal stress UspA family protein
MRMKKTVKTLVGVDLLGSYESAIELCKRIKFENQEWVFVHALPVLPWYVPGMFPQVIPVAETVDALNDSGRLALTRARKLVGDYRSTDHMQEGDAATMLNSFAKDEDADLIVMGSGHPKNGPLWKLGSVSRALSIEARKSLLVAKLPSSKSGPVHAVFATDHSEYANRALDQLISWNPQGFSRIDIVTAYEVNASTTAMLKRDTSVDLEFQNWVRDHCLKESAKVAEKLKAVAPEINVIVEEGESNEVIRNAMTSSDADLLIMGAQGHGFLDRLVIGSTSHHHFVAEQYPVLLLRLPSEKE